VDTENTIHKKTTYLYPNKRKDRITTTAFIADDDETQIQIDWYIVLTSSAMGRYRRTQYIKEDFMSLHFKAQEYASCRDRTEDFVVVVFDYYYYFFPCMKRKKIL
jgi:hypothetical protein